MGVEQAANVITIDLSGGFPAGIAETPEAFAEALRLAAAIEWYREGRISQGTGAEVAGLSRAEFLEALARAKVSASQVGVDELMEQVDRAVEAHRRRITPDLALQSGKT